MKRKALITALLFAVVKMTTMADLPSPKYYYHAVPQSVFNEWQEHRKSVNAASTDSYWHKWLEECKNTAWEKCKMAGRTVLEKYGFIASIGLIVYFSVFVVFLRQRRYKLVLLWFLFAGVALSLGIFGFFRKHSFKAFAVPANYHGGVITKTVKPNDGESYYQYQTRVYRKGHDLCEVCGTRMEHWYDMGKHSGCPKCNKLYGTCKECGKEFKRFGRQFLFQKAGGVEVDSGELCDACIKEMAWQRKIEKSKRFDKWDWWMHAPSLHHNPSAD